MMPFIVSAGIVSAGCRGRRHAEPLAAIGFRPGRLPPPAIVEIPRDGLAQSGLEALARPPTQFTAQLRSVHRVAPVVPGPVFDKGDQPGMRSVRRVWRQLVEEATNPGDHLQIGPLAVAADVVAL